MAGFPGYALVVGVGTYVHGSMRDLSVAAADARAVARVLRDPQQCGYPEQHVTLLCDGDATHKAILQALDDLAARATRDDTIFLFYSGQGQYDEHGVYSLTTADTQLTDNQTIAQGTAIRQDELLECLCALQSVRVLIVFDTDHVSLPSPVLSLDEEPLVSSPLPSELASALLATGEGRVIISASRENQHSYPGAGMTYLGQALLDGLRGEGVPNRAGYIDVFDLYTFLYTTVIETVQQRYRADQEPELTILKGTTSFPVALHRGVSTARGDFTALAQPPGNAAVRKVDEVDSRALLAQIQHRSMNASTGVSFGVLGEDDDDTGVQFNNLEGYGVLGIDDEESAPAVPKSLPATAGPGTSLEHRHLEAAMPRCARVSRPTEIRTMIAVPGSEGLRKYLPALTESGELIARNDVAGSDLLVAFEDEWITLFLELDAPDFDIEQSVKLLRVPRMSDSGVATFFVTPRRARNDGRVVVNVFQDRERQTLIGSLTLIVDIKGRNVTMFFEEVWQIVISSVSTASPARQTMAMAGVGQQIVYMNVQNQTVVQGDQYNLSGTFRGSNITIKSNLSNASQSIGTLADVRQTDKDELQRLLQQLNAALQEAPVERQDDAEAVATLARELLDTATTGTPNRTTVRIATDGLRQATNQIADAVPSVTSLVAAMITRITWLGS